MSQPTSQSESESETVNDKGLFPISPGTGVYRIGFYIATLAYVSYLLFTAMDFSPDNRIFPYIIGIPTVALILLQIVLIRYPVIEYRVSMDDDADGVKQMLEDAKESDTGRSRAERQKYEVLMIGWVITLPIMIYYLGLAIALPIYIFAFGWHFTRDVKLALFMSLGFSFSAYLLFIVILGLIPWQGVLGIPSPLDYLPPIQLPI